MTIIITVTIFATDSTLSSSHLSPTLTPHLPNSGVLLSKSDNNDAVGLTNTPLSPWGQRVVCLVKNNAMEVFLLAQPAGQTVLMDTEEGKESINDRRHCLAGSAQ